MRAFWSRDLGSRARVIDKVYTPLRNRAKTEAGSLEKETRSPFLMRVKECTFAIIHQKGRSESPADCAASMSSVLGLSVLGLGTHSLKSPKI